MRWIFFVLLILNAFYFVWMQLGVGGASIPLAGSVANPPKDQVLQLLGERRDTSTARDSMCMYWGPFSQESQAQGLLQQMLSLDVAAAIAPKEDNVGGDYWVYLAPQVSKDAAANLLREVSARDIDAHLIAEGELRNGVSLGLFAQREQADEVIERARSGGYTPYMRIVTRTQKVYWVRIEPSAQRLIDAVFINRVQERFKGVSNQLMSC